MEFSKHNILSPIKNSSNWVLINLLSGNADIIEAEVAQKLQQGDWTQNEDLLAKGYLVDPESEKKLFNQKYLDFLDERDSDEIQIFFVPQYSCNFSCSYCFQEEYDWSKSPLKDEVLDAFFNYIDSTFAGRRKYLTLFGGEPLLPGSSHQQKISRFLKMAKDRNLDVAVVTNGYSLSEYIEVLKIAHIREIQVTLDGPEPIHNQRRTPKDGKPSFNKIAEGIDLCLKNNLPVNLRAVVDRENLSSLPALAEYAISKGWTQNPLFKTQLGRNYELHNCQVGGASKLLSRVEMYEELFAMIHNNPHFLEFHRPAFSISKFLFENGELPAPLFDSCTGTTTEWAFDYQGRIFACTATVGKSGEVLGTFFPDITRHEEIIAQWEERDITSIPECKECPVSLACGGGCTAVAKNRTGQILSTDCRPAQKLIELGVSLYFEKPATIESTSIGNS
jgi:uncharacterized protein